MSIAEKFEVIADRVYEKGIDEGTKKMWDAMTSKGKRIVGVRMFNECDFTEIQELPYKWKCTSGNISQIFYNYTGKKLPNPEYVDLSYLPENNNSSHTNGLCAWYSSANCGITNAVFPDYGIPAPNFCTQWFAYSTALETIEILRVHENTTFSSTFASNSDLNLVNITFEGTIGQDLNLSKCPKLSYDSFDNIINCLKDFTISDDSATITLHDDSKTLIGEEGLKRITDKGWEVM